MARFLLTMFSLVLFLLAPIYCAFAIPIVYTASGDYVGVNTGPDPPASVVDSTFHLMMQFDSEDSPSSTRSNIDANVSTYIPVSTSFSINSVEVQTINASLFLVNPSYGDGIAIMANFATNEFGLLKLSIGNVVSSFNFLKEDYPEFPTFPESRIDYIEGIGLDNFECELDFSIPNYPYPDPSNVVFSLTEFKSRPVPEPTTMLLLGTGLVGLAVIGRKRFKK